MLFFWSQKITKLKAVAEQCLVNVEVECYFSEVSRHRKLEAVIEQCLVNVKVECYFSEVNR